MRLVRIIAFTVLVSRICDNKIVGQKSIQSCINIGLAVAL